MSQEMSPPSVPVANAAAAAASPGIETMIAVALGALAAIFVGALLLLLVICRRHRWYYNQKNSPEMSSDLLEGENGFSLGLDTWKSSEWLAGAEGWVDDATSNTVPLEIVDVTKHGVPKSQAHKLTFIDQTLNNIDSHLLILRNAALAQEAACSIPASTPV